jgi:hypothetical protein
VSLFLSVSFSNFSFSSTAIVTSTDKGVYNIIWTNPYTNLSENVYFEGTLNGTLDGNPAIFYCTDINHYLYFDGVSYKDSENTIPKITYILNNYYPFIPFSYTGSLSALDSEAAAVRMAIWHFSDGLDVTTLYVTTPDDSPVLAHPYPLHRQVNYEFNGILPVELSSFTSNVNGRNVNLIWGTKTEKNSDKFVIERKTIGDTWEAIASVKAAVLSNSPKNYSYLDTKLQSGKYQYRLKMVDNDGSFSYSSVEAAEVAIPKDFAVSQNYPNPFNPSTKIDDQVPVDAKVILEVYNIAGQKVVELVNQEQSAGYYKIDFGASKLSSGVYIYRIVASDKATGNNFSSIKKMMLLK